MGENLIQNTEEMKSAENRQFRLSFGCKGVRFYSFLIAFIFLGTTAPAQLFSDDFTRGADPVGLTSPWQTNSGLPGGWTVTGGELHGGPNGSVNYGYAYVSTNAWTNYSVQAKVRFSSASGYGGGIGGRLDSTSGAHYAAWIYPDSSPGGSNVIRLINFSSWNSFTVMALVNVGSVGTNFHTIKLTFQTNNIALTYDGTQLTNVNDSTLSSGGITVEMWSDVASYFFGGG